MVYRRSESWFRPETGPGAPGRGGAEEKRGRGPSGERAIQEAAGWAYIHKNNTLKNTLYILYLTKNILQICLNRVCSMAKERQILFKVKTKQKL